jgi:hypothetical protein
LQQVLCNNGSRDLNTDILDHLDADTLISVPLTDEEASTELSAEIPGLGSTIEEEEDLYGYSGDEEDKGKKNRKVAIAGQGSDKPRTVESPMELSFEDNLADTPYPYDGESSEVNDSNSGPPHCTGVASADQVGEGEPEVTLISADDMTKEGELAFSPQFFIPESTPDSISSDNFSPINTQANQGMGEILESNLVNRGEPMQVDGDLYREVMNNAEGKAVMETINPILLLPDLPTSNPEPMDTEDSPLFTEDSPLSIMSESEFFELEREMGNLKLSNLESAPDQPSSNPEPVDTEDSPLSTEDSPLTIMSESEFFELEREISKPGKST